MVVGISDFSVNFVVKTQNCDCGGDGDVAHGSRANANTTSC